MQFCCMFRSDLPLFAESHPICYMGRGLTGGLISPYFIITKNSVVGINMEHAKMTFNNDKIYDIYMIMSFIWR